MLMSMTGYGNARTETPDLSVAVEVRSVNNRYLKVLTRTPDFLSALEPEIEGAVRKRLSRGAVTVMVHCRRLGRLARPPVNRELMAGYAAELREMADELNLDENLRVADLVGLPGVLEEDEGAGDVAPMRGPVLETLSAAMDDFETFRRTEGEALEADLRKHVAVIREHLRVITDLAPTVVEEYRDRLLDRISVLLKSSPVELAAETLMTEVSVFAERSDVSEELARLDSHLGQFDDLLDVAEPSGRKLEFVAQEMLREANTTGSKSGHPEIGRRTVEIKAAIDRIKEQVQNCE